MYKIITDLLTFMYQDIWHFAGMLILMLLVLKTLLAIVIETLHTLKVLIRGYEPANTADTLQEEPAKDDEQNLSK